MPQADDVTPRTRRGYVTGLAMLLRLSNLQEHRALLKQVPDYELLHAKIANDVIEAMRVTARTTVR